MPDGERISYTYFTAFDWFTWLQDKTELYLPGRDKCGEVQPEGVHGTLPMQPSGDTS